jgi:ketosteroid isomerase-like protein
MLHKGIRDGVGSGGLYRFDDEWERSSPSPVTLIPRLPELDDFAAAEWVRSYDAAWMSEDWHGLLDLLTPDVVFRIHSSRRALSGRAAVISWMRDFMGRAHVAEYAATDIRGSHRAGVALITYRWHLEWGVDAGQRATAGRDRLFMIADRGQWLLRARVQFEEPAPQAAT